MLTPIDEIFDKLTEEFHAKALEYIKNECVLVSEEIDDGDYFRIYENKKLGTQVFARTPAQATGGADCVFAEVPSGHYDKLLKKEIKKVKWWAGDRSKELEWILQQAKHGAINDILENRSPSYCNRWHNYHSYGWDH